MLKELQEVRIVQKNRLKFSQNHMPYTFSHYLQSKTGSTFRWVWSLCTIKLKDFKQRPQRAGDGCQVLNASNWNPAAYLWVGIKWGGSQSGRGLAVHASPTYCTLHATLPLQWVQCGYYLAQRASPSLITSTAVIALLHIRHMSACLSLPCKSKGPVSKDPGNRAA